MRSEAVGQWAAAKRAGPTRSRTNRAELPTIKSKPGGRSSHLREQHTVDNTNGVQQAMGTSIGIDGKGQTQKKTAKLLEIVLVMSLSVTFGERAGW